MPNIDRRSLGPICIVAALHAVGGVALLAEPEASSVSSLAGLLMPPGTKGVILLIASGLALVARFYRHNYATALLIPQQIVLLLQGWGASMAIWHGVYPDGHVPDGGSLFILADQAGLLILVAWHTFEMASLDRMKQNDVDRAHITNSLWSKVKLYEEGKDWRELVAGMELAPRQMNQIECESCAIHQTRRCIIPRTQAR